MNWPRISQTEESRTPGDPAGAGGVWRRPVRPSDGMQILALIEEQMSEELKKAAAESAAQAKVAAMRELAAMLGPDSPQKNETPVEIAEIPLEESNEAERVAAAFFGEKLEEVKEVAEVKEVKEVAEVKAAAEAKEPAGLLELAMQTAAEMPAARLEL